MTAETPARKSTILIPVFAPAVIVALLLVIGTISNPELAGEVFANMLSYITRTFGWFYMLAVAIFLMFIVTVAFSKWGNIKLGPDHAEPQYSFLSWFAMLFSAGYGIALLFFGVAEPVLHYADPPAGAVGLTTEAARQAMQIAFFHWGFHIWAIYGLVGLVLAYFAFRHGLPLSVRSGLYPLIGERIYGPIGHTVDTSAILGTIFGIATTLGLSVAQINAGMNYLWGSIPVSTTVQVICIAVITLMTMGSVVAGMDKGIKNLAMLNMIIATGLMLFVFIAGPTIFILEAWLQNTGSYLNNIVERTFNLQAYSRSDWIGNWTLFIFGWTIAWAPFVGLFIAKISRGRTIRQFVVGVMLVPTLFTFLWFSVFGDTALHLIVNEGYTALIDEVKADNAIALFKVLEQLPFSSVVSFITVLLITLFFITSADSGALVIDSLASGGAVNTPAWQRAFWAILCGVLASVLLIAGGLKALQSMAIASALPFAIIMLLSAVGLWRALVIETHRSNSLRQPMNNTGRSGQWTQRLAGIMDYPQREQVQAFIATDVMNAMTRLSQRLADQGWPATTEYDIEQELGRAIFKVEKPDELDFVYEVRLRDYALPEFAFPNDEADASKENAYYRADVFLTRGGLDYDIYGYNQQEIIGDILDHFERYLHFLRLSPGVLPWNMAEHDEMLNQ